MTDPKTTNGPLFDNAFGQIEKEIAKMDETVLNIKKKLKSFNNFDEPDVFNKTPEPVNPVYPGIDQQEVQQKTIMNRFTNEIEKLNKHNTDLNIVLDWLNDLV